MLDRVAKGITAQQAAAAVASARQAGIKPAGHFIYGLPGETEESMHTTLRFAKTIGLDIAQFYCCAAFPGSRLYGQACREGWIRDSEFSRICQDRACLNLPTVAAASIERFRARSYREFYLNPATWLRVVRMLDIRGLLHMWPVLKTFLRWSGG